MGRNGSLTTPEKAVITSQFAEGKTTLEISKKIGRQNQPVKNFVKGPNKIWKRADEGKSRVIDRRSLSRIKREIVMNPGLTSEEHFKRIV